MKYLLQFEFEKDKESQYWLPLFIDLDSHELAEEKGKEIFSLINKDFKNVSNYSIQKYNNDAISNEIIKDYIKDEREGEFSILSTKDSLNIVDVDSNADRVVEFDKEKKQSQILANEQTQQAIDYFTRTEDINFEKLELGVKADKQKIAFTLLFIFSIYSVPHNSILFYSSGIFVLGTLLMYIFSDK